MRACTMGALGGGGPEGEGGEREAAGLGSELWLSWLLGCQLMGSLEAKLSSPLPQAGWLTPA